MYFIQNHPLMLYRFLKLCTMCQRPRHHDTQKNV